MAKRGIEKEIPQKQERSEHTTFANAFSSLDLNESTDAVGEELDSSEDKIDQESSIVNYPHRRPPKKLSGKGQKTKRGQKVQ